MNSTQSELSKDFLFFEGVNDSAHLFRQNSTILLNVNNKLYKTDIVDRIQFSWRGFKVNGSEMEKIKSTGEEKVLRGGVHPDFFVKLGFEITVDQQTRTSDRTFEGVPDPNRQMVPAGQPRPYLVQIRPNLAKYPEHAQNPDLRCFTCS